MEYILFLPIVLCIYWLLKKVVYQNLFLLIASYFFYGLWDYRFLSLIIISSLSDYILGLLIYESKTETKKNLYLFISLLINLGILFFFKYFNFFIDSFNILLGKIDYETTWSTLNIILPVGISFYTFQTLSYSIDIYKERIKPTRDIIIFFTYVSFFPQLVAGPIERASSLLPQFKNKRKINYSTCVDGLRQILAGLFKKVVIADNCAVYTDIIFANYENLDSASLMIGALLFSFQLYCDFSGYSDIAIGSARLLGIELMKNFATPFFSANISELWRRWHISLSTWFRDYLYFPLTFKLRYFGMKGIYISTIISFTIIGLWHGANWNYIVFGLLHALAIVYELRTEKIRKSYKKKIPMQLYKTLSIILTFLYWTFTCIFFRSQSLPDSFNYISRLFTSSNINNPVFSPEIFVKNTGYLVFIYITMLLMLEWFNQEGSHLLSKMPKNDIVRWNYYILLILLVIAFFGEEVNFIYFQF